MTSYNTQSSQLRLRGLQERYMQLKLIINNMEIEVQTDDIT